MENLPENCWDGTEVWVARWWWPYVRLGSDQFQFQYQFHITFHFQFHFQFHIQFHISFIYRWWWPYVRLGPDKLDFISFGW